jgi:hypothetical protein
MMRIHSSVFYGDDMVHVCSASCRDKLALIEVLDDMPDDAPDRPLIFDAPESSAFEPSQTDPELLARPLVAASPTCGYCGFDCDDDVFTVQREWEGDCLEVTACSLWCSDHLHETDLARFVSAFYHSPFPDRMLREDFVG